MVLPAYDGRSLSLNLAQAFAPAIQEGKQRKERQEITNLARTASGLPPVPEQNAGGFLAKVAPGLANTIQKLNQNRQPDLIDEARSEAEIGLDTSRRILAAKTPTEKQKIILARAEQVQRAGGDPTELLRMSSMSPAEIDLQAQKTAMTSDAALKSLPAPTEQERAAARAELAVRNPQALNAILAQEQLAQEQQLAQQKLAQQRQATAQGQQLIGQVFGGGGALPNDPLAASTQLIAGFEGFRETPYFDVNALRTGFGSDTVTLETGEVVPVTEGTVVTQEDALRDLQRRITTEFAPRAREAVTPEIYDNLSPQQQAALNSITYNYGSLPERVASVARTGDIEATAQAIAALGSDNEGINANRRAQEAQIFAGGGQQQPQQISQQEVAALLANPNIPDSVKDFAVAEYERQIEAQAQGQQPASDLGQTITNLQADIDRGIVPAEEGAQAIQAAIADTIKDDPSYTILSPEEAEDKLGPGYDETKTYQVSPEGRVSAIGGGGVTVNVPTGEAVKLTERQSQMALFGSQMAAAQPVFDTLEQGGFDPAGISQFLATQGGDIGNFFNTPEGRQYNAAKNAWAEGVLRIQTGAAATQPEIDRVTNTYFASVGDDASTIAFKRQLREAYANSLGLASGGLVNPNEMADSVLGQKIDQGKPVLSPSAYAGLQGRRPDLTPEQISEWFNGLTEEQQKAVNEQFN